MTSNTLLERHPDYRKWEERWEIARDAYDGEQAIKDKTTDYLPKPGGFTALGEAGTKAYEA